MINREDLLKPTGFPKYEIVEIPDYGTCWVKALSAGERDRFEAEHAAKEGGDFRARLVAASVIDERGMCVFGPDDVHQLTELPAYILEPIVQASVRINRLSKEAQDDLRKNLNGQAVTS